jgi:SAF domain
MATLTGLRRSADGRAAVPASPRPRRRSWALAVIGVLVVAVCALVFAAGWVQAGNRKPVLAVVHDVAAGQLLTAADLQVVRVSASGPVSLVPAAAEASVLGRPAAGPLPAGALLTSGDIGPAAPAAGQDDLGVAVKAGQYPPDLSAGQTVDVLATPAASSAGSSSQATSSPALPVGQAVVLGVDTVASSGATVVELRLSQNAVPQVAAAAATGQIALATIPAGG